MTTFEIVSLIYMAAATLGLAISIGFNFKTHKQNTDQSKQLNLQSEQLINQAKTTQHFDRFAEYYDAVLKIINEITPIGYPQIEHVVQLVRLSDNSEKYFDEDVQQYLNELLNRVSRFALLHHFRRSHEVLYNSAELFFLRQIADLQTSFSGETQRARQVFLPYLKGV